MLKLELNGEMLSMVYAEYKRQGNEEGMDEIENKLIKIGFDDWDNLSDELFENLVYSYIYRTIYPKYENEDWYDEFSDYSFDNIDKKMQKFAPKCSKDSKEMKKQVRNFIKNEIKSWLNEYVGTNHGYIIK